MKVFNTKEVKNALMIGIISSISYFACYFARNILSVASPDIVATTDITLEYIGPLSTANMLSYAIGQLINGIIGDKVKGKYLVSGGLLFAGISEVILGFSNSPITMIIAYSFMGFFLSMIYAPLTKLIAENTHPIHAMRCCLGLTFASFFGAPVAGVVALAFNWKSAFILCGMILIVMGAIFYLSILFFEKREIVKYREQTKKEKIGKSGGIKVLLKNQIVKFSLVAVLTGIVRTSVVFWIPTYLSQHLGFSAGISATMFTIITCAQSVAPFVNNLIVYERLLKRDMNKMILLAFSASTISFVMMFVVEQPIINILFLLVALVTASGASDMLWSIYCPSLRDTGMVSSATGYLDFVSYMAAAAANLLFANAISQIGWGKLILVWAALMLVGVLISLPRKKKENVA